MRLKNKVAVITGAGSQGIGRGIAHAFIREGAKVVIAGRTLSRLENAAQELKGAGGQVETAAVDVSKPQDADRLIRQTIERFGRLDILVNNAGILRDGHLMLMPDKDWDEVLDTHLKGTFYCCRAALRPMIGQRKGRIINLASPSAITGRAGQTNYAAAKGGVIT